MKSSWCLRAQAPYQGVHVDRMPSWYEALDRLHTVMGPLSVAFIDQRAAESDLRRYVTAALVAYDAELTSLDYVLREYVGDAHAGVASAAEEEADVLLDAYELVVHSMRAARARLAPQEAEPPTVGEFSASIGLERLVTSFKSAHLLYRLGHCTDADAVSRVILEQAAWAYKVGSLGSFRDVEQVQPQRAMTNLRQLYPDAGRLYGFLSDRVHQDVAVHQEMFSREGDRNVIGAAKQCVPHACGVLVRLCDIYLAVWEATQARHLTSLESVFIDGAMIRLHDDRPFKMQANEQLARARGE